MKCICGLALCSLMTLGSTQATGADEPLAWVSFAPQATQSYEGTPYLWLGEASVELSIETQISRDHAIDLLWGSKDDQRGASIEINGKTVKLQAGGYQGFRWQRIELPAELSGQQYKVTIRAGSPKPAFFAAVRLVTTATPTEADTDLAAPSPIAIQVKHDLPASPAPQTTVPTFADLPPLQRNAAQANQAFKQCRLYVDGWLAHADPKTGLIPRNLQRDADIWNGRDSAADNYPFMVMTCALTDREMYQGRMMQMLENEIRCTSRIGNLGDVYSFSKQGFQYDEPDLPRLIFDNSEYVKDGLMPLTELLGHTRWTDRMVGIIDDILANSSYQTPTGPIPSDNVEVNGEMMQMLGRLYWMTGDQEYLVMATRIADYYLLGDHHPTRDAAQLRLDDHSCELISGLTEVYITCHFAAKAKAAEYREPIYAMLDRILELGVNQDGLMYDTIDPVAGKVLKPALTDNWGYNYNGFYAVYQVDGVDKYREAVVKALRGLSEPKYLVYPWEGWGSDGIADSVEGAINLYNREPVEGADAWIDANIFRMLSIQKEDGVIEGWHGDGNFARTAIMWALWKQQGVTVQPWRPDVKLGAVKTAGGVQLLLTAGEPWQGNVIFDTPRHKTVMRMPLDYPRINQFPEWFTVDERGTYRVAIDGDASSATPGSAMIKGLPLRVDAGRSVQIEVTAVE